MNFQVILSGKSMDTVLHNDTEPSIKQYRNSHPEVFLGKDVPKICSKLTGKYAKQLYWNHTSAQVFPCKFAASFWNTFS